MNGTNDSKRVWLVTGASRGLGAEIARAALAAGDRVVATARDPRAVVAALGEHPSLVAIALDVNDEASIGAATERAIATFGKIDVLVNNAGFGVVGAVEETSAADVRRVFETNVFGLLAVTRAVLPHMRSRKGGHVVNLSSVGGVAAAPGYGVYCATKFAVEGISEALHAELAPLGIRVTVVEPGYFRTEFLSAGSIVHNALRIPDYEATAGKVRGDALERDGKQPGDPKKLADAMIALVRSAEPPRRLALGRDTVAVTEAKLAAAHAELEASRATSIATDIGA